MKKLIFSLFSIFLLLALPLQARVISFPAIIDEDNREEITGKASKLEQTVVIIELSKYDAADGISYTYLCSGTLVESNIVLTSAHCINGVEDLRTVEVYAVGFSKQELSNNENKNNNLKLEMSKWIYDETGKVLFPYATAKKLWVPNKYKDAILDKGDENSNINRVHYDYGLIILDYDLGEIINWSKLKIMSDEELNDAKIVLIGRGADKEEYSLWKSQGSIKEIDKYVVYYDADTLDGNSGGAVFEANNIKNIIALHNWEYTPEDVNLYSNVGLRIRQEIIDAVETVANGGTLPGMKIIEDDSDSN